MTLRSFVSASNRVGDQIQRYSAQKTSALPLHHLREIRSNLMDIIGLTLMSAAKIW
jgi:hypothetical protein